MQSTLTYTQARANLAKICNSVTDDQEIVIITRRNAEPVAMISASELSGLIETAHLLRSPKNAERLFSALERAKSKKVKPQSLKEFTAEIKIDKEKRK
ncbi:MAG TPA: type II toxin-antitoxin system prevent-host-death family antitoxin [Ignavibacteriales bacterium]|nr:type II toxin-antitoxin system prevent-host-death family antitoxin [Ignavibacteriales bacterium]